MLRDGTYGCAIRDGNKILPLLPTEQGHRTVNQLHYRYWELEDEERAWQFIPSEVKSSMLLLPVLLNPDVGLYTAIDSKWNEMHTDGVFRLPNHLTEKENNNEMVAI